MYCFLFFKDFLEGSASYVSVAMDQYLNLPYGTILCIPELDRKYGKHIIFKVHDAVGSKRCIRGSIPQRVTQPHVAPRKTTQAKFGSTRRHKA